MFLTSTLNHLLTPFKIYDLSSYTLFLFLIDTLVFINIFQTPSNFTETCVTFKSNSLTTLEEQIMHVTKFELTL